MSDPATDHHELGAILDDAPCGFLRFRDDGTIVRANATLLAMLEMTREVIEEQTISMILAPGAKVFFQTHFFPSLRLQGSVKEFYLSLRNSAGSDLPVLVNAVRRKLEGEIVNDCVFVEMVERERFEDALLQAKRSAEEADRSKESALRELSAAMASLARAKDEVDAASRAKDDFLAALSHELRTPLTPVLLMASILEEDSSLPAKIRSHLAMMRRNIELEASLIDDLLDVTRIRSGKLTLNKATVDLHAILERTREIVSHECTEKNLTLRVKPEASRHFLNADSARIQQVLWNLVKNAIKFTPRDGSITVSTENVDDTSVVVKVSDTGIGIPEEHLVTIFNRFEQGRVAGQHQFGGLGLGLSICQAIIGAHEGEIRAESEGEGGGAEFSFRLETITAPERLESSKPDGAVSTERLDILLVEDHETTRRVLSARLSRLGHRVTAVGTVSEGAAAFHSAVFGIVISDLGLPDGSGLDLMREIRQSSDVPSIALSGYGMPEEVEKTRKAGFTTHLIKPIKMDELLSVIHDIANAEAAGKSVPRESATEARSSGS